ncbi:NAD(P)-dependent dehydrogenase, short-chain alcohol dehydrogenase family [Agrococcus baldri]|uniref:NAD(P)-dependent dehydrogenase, short-chain alcohol dehydrogenase family n=1 Tax=Agrococcus baldri TaxID=153730 RepID=A0AA94HN80_9MICO|nr:SDR family oxidoreductase [Agrococcus baldri]SFS14879.1 NAD(P)-dependent dehydrogenase, short-chain alcohol dehydrogenase family [Agrococcus baldri]
MTGAIVTGGGTGIGRAVALQLAREGWHVVVTGRRAAPLEDTAALAPERIRAVAADASDRQAMDAVVQTALESGPLGALITSAGGHGYSSVAETTDEEWSSSLQANLTTAFVACRAALPALADGGGSIVIVSSLAGIRAAPETTGYTVGKHALLGLMRQIARDGGRDGVRANAVCPGWVRTPMADEEMGVLIEQGRAATLDEAYALVTRDVPLGRAAQPEEVAELACFLAGPASSYLTGATIVIDGGAHVVDVPTLAFG